MTPDRANNRLKFGSTVGQVRKRRCRVPVGRQAMHLCGRCFVDLLAFRGGFLNQSSNDRELRSAQLLLVDRQQFVARFTANGNELRRR